MQPSETSCAGLDSPQPAPTEVQLIFEAEVLRLVGGINRVTLWRWIRDGRFPRPLAWPARRVKVWRRAAVSEFLAGIPSR